MLSFSQVGGVVFAVVSVLGVVVWYSQSTFAAAGSSRIAQQALRRRPLRQPIMITPHVNHSSDAPAFLEEYGVGLDTIIERDAAPNDQYVLVLICNASHLTSNTRTNNADVNANPSPTTASSSTTAS